MSSSPATKAGNSKGRPPHPSGEVFLYTPGVPRTDAVRIGMVYPAPYAVAMSSLGYLMLFKQLDENPLAAVRRINSETYAQYRNPDAELLGYSFSFELDIFEILNSFAQLGLPARAADRADDAPLVFAGGPTVMSNPEPYADFFDFFVVGEGEEVLQELVSAYHDVRHLKNRADRLRALAAQVKGVYAPSLYDVSYDSPEGAVTAITPRFDDVPAVVGKRWLENPDAFISSTPILTEDTVFANSFLVEVMRGCAHRCRFCLASYSMLPARGPTVGGLMATLEAGLQHTRKVGLLGALVSEHPDFPALCEYLRQQENIRISTSSLRADGLTADIVATLKHGGQQQVTLAVETGSDRLKRRINKNLKNEEVLAAADTVAAGGLQGLKLYGMVGLPDETESDVAALADLVKQIRGANKALKLSLTVSSFVPKGGTPFQWQAKVDNATVKHRQTMLHKALLKVADVRPTSPKWDYVQALLARGDRRLGPLIERFVALGHSLGSLHRADKALRAEGCRYPSLDWYTLRERPEAEVLPWDLIDLGVPKAILYKEGLPPPGFENL
ncbi:MAG: radical SAM protein [Candidatus Melainabacteria bacterium]